MNKVQSALNTVNEQNSFIQNLAKKEQQFLLEPIPHAIEDIQKYENHVDQNYDKALSTIADILKEIDSALKQNSSYAQTETAKPLPSRAEVDAMLYSFYKEKIKTKAAPIPTYCGCYANRCKTLSYGNFVCARYQNQYLLMIVHQADNDSVECINPKDPSGVQVVRLPLDQITPLPRLIPEKPLARWEHARQANVLSLWPLDNGEWTSTFFPAVVVDRPCDRQDANSPDNPRGYKLSFSDDQFIVPEQFVVTFPDQWKNDK